jgi:hypothetical protein
MSLVQPANAAVPAELACITEYGMVHWLPRDQYWVSEKQCREAEQRKAGKQEFLATHHATLLT